MNWLQEKLKRFEGDPEFELEKAMLEVDQCLINIKKTLKFILEDMDKDVVLHQGERHLEIQRLLDGLYEA